LSGKHIKSLAAKYRNFPLYTAPVVLINTISLQIPAIILAYYFGPVVVGFYGLTYRVLIAPMNLIGRSFSQVFFPKATEDNRSGELGQITQKVFSKLFLLGFIPMLLFVGVAPDIFIFLFGLSWHTAGIYAQILCPWFFFQFISSPLTSIFYILEKQQIFLFWNIGLLCSRIIVISIGGLMKSQMIAIILLGGSGVLMYGLLIVIIFYITGSGRAALKSLIRIIIWIPFVAIYLFSIPYLNTFYSLLLFGTCMIIYFIFSRPKLNKT
ncbi:MAG: oligosaccharide flippase family protein, partial [Candidatus Methanofastidiosa archaeon]|nr:oligosaccharide flippase family protein [Candidatus Methanofastidiosa archaeon]